MKKFCLLFLGLSLCFCSLGFGQNSYKETQSIQWFSKGVAAFENQNYSLAKKYFEQEEQTVLELEKYKLLTSLALKEKDAGKKTVAYFKEHPFATNKTKLIVALSNYYFNRRQNKTALYWLEKVDVKDLSLENQIKHNYKLAFVYYKNKKYTKAKQYLLPLAARGGYKNEANYYLGNIALENKDYNSALGYFDEIKNVKKYKREVTYQRLVILYKQKEYARAIDLGVLNFMKVRGTEQSQMAKIIGESFFYLGDYKDALHYLTQYKGRGRKYTEVDYYFLGYTYFKLGKLEKAIEHFNKITDEKTGVAQNAHYHLGECYLQKNQKTQALNAFKNASEMNFDLDIQQEAYLNYAKLGYEIGNPYTSSSKVLQAYIDKYPDSVERVTIEKLIVNAFLQAKDFKGAIAYFDENKLVKNEVYQLSLLERGFEFYNVADYNQALDFFSKATSLYYNTTYKNRALFWKAETMLELNDVVGATYQYKAFVNNYGNRKLLEYNDGLYGYAYSLFQQKKYVQALTQFKLYVAKSDDEAKKTNAVLRMADCYFVIKNYWSALENYNRVIKTNKAQVDYAYYQKALAYGFLQKKEQKKQTLETLQKQFSKSGYLDKSYFELGNLYVNMLQNKKAIAVYNQLISKYPKSPLVAKAKLKKGTILFNDSENQESLKVLKSLVATYPGTKEAVQAVKIAEQVYKEMDQVDLYAIWVKKIEFINITDAEIDKTMFEAAENQYLTNNLKATISSCKKYLANFPNGTYSLTIQFYLAQAYYNTNQKEKSISPYKEVLNREVNEYTEVALSRLSQIYLENQEWNKASELLLQIEKETTNEQQLVYAQSNLMKHYYQQKEYKQALAYTNKVLKNKQSKTKAVEDAYVVGARSAMALKKTEEAKIYYSKLEVIGQEALKAEAFYYKALWLHKDKDYKLSNEQIQFLTSNFQSQKKWGIKGLLIMAQNFYALDDAFQANFILNNIISNATEHKEQVAVAKELLAKYKGKTGDETRNVEPKTNVENEF